jgi:hypothetical protein
MTTSLRFAAILGMVVAARAVPAAAQTVATTAEREVAAPPPDRFWDGRVGMLVGDAQVGNTDGTSVGINAGYGYQRGNWAGRGELSYYSVGDDSSTTMPRRGRAVRGALLGRYSFVATDADSTFLANLWGEAGVGYEHVAWATGGVLDRPDLELAVGVDLGVRRDGDAPAGTRRRRVAYFMAIRSFIAEGPVDPSAPAQCGGPCSMATTPPRTDVSLLFEWGIHFGR